MLSIIVMFRYRPLFLPHIWCLATRDTCFPFLLKVVFPDGQHTVLPSPCFLCGPYLLIFFCRLIFPQLDIQCWNFSRIRPYLLLLYFSQLILVICKFQSILVSFPVSVIKCPHKGSVTEKSSFQLTASDYSPYDGKSQRWSLRELVTFHPQSISRERMHAKLAVFILRSPGSLTQSTDPLHNQDESSLIYQHDQMILHRHVLRPVSQVVLECVKLTMNIVNQCTVTTTPCIID